MFSTNQPLSFGLLLTVSWDSAAEDIRVFSRGMFGYSHVLTIEEEVFMLTAAQWSSSEVWFLVILEAM